MLPKENQPQPENEILDSAHAMTLSNEANSPTDVNPIVGRFAEAIDDSSNEPQTNNGLPLRTKATALALLLGTLPIAAVGGIGFFTAQNTLLNSERNKHELTAKQLIDQVNRFVYERYGDIQIVANQEAFVLNANAQQKVQVLERFKETYKIYDSIAVFDLQGNTIAQTKGDPLGKHADRTYFQEVLRTGQAVISQPSISKSSGLLVVHFAAPIRDSSGSKVIGVVRSRMPVVALKPLLANATVGHQYNVVSRDGTVFLNEADQNLGVKIAEILPEVPNIDRMNQVKTALLQPQNGSASVLAGYAATESLNSMPDVNWGIVFATPQADALRPITDMAKALGLGALATGLVASTIAIALTNRSLKPLQEAVDATARMSQGDLDINLPVGSADELGTLNRNINEMAAELKTLLGQQKQQAEFANALTQLVNDMGQSNNRDEIFSITTNRLREALNSSRVIIYEFHDDWNGTVIAESAAIDCLKILGETVEDPFREGLIDLYRNGRVRAMNDITTENLTRCHEDILDGFQIKASIAAPVLRNGKLIGLLCVHECAGPRQWEAAEVSFVQQIALQVGNALDRAYLLNYTEIARQEARKEADERAQQQQEAKELLQRRALELLMEVDPVSQGDLTVRAKVTPDEVGTIADSYNAIIRSLRQLVLQVQDASQTVSHTAVSNESSVQQLAAEGRLQMEVIRDALTQVQATVQSVQGVAKRAAEAEQGVLVATRSIAAGDAAMNQTVEGISAIRETVAETAKKVKRLGEASQRISKVVSLINGFAAQTNLLALNAAIEAVRAGEQGQGFAMVAEEVRSLAQQSSVATAEIEQLVEEIQTQTNDVVLAMEAGTEQVVEGTQLVAATREKLSEITTVSTRINRLITEISQATTVQTQAYATVSQTMEQVATIADGNSKQSETVAESFSRLLEVAETLQVSVSQFKVS
jgi:methyl-accepting chemotaxis protein PixJ